MPWIQILLETTSDHVPRLESLLMEAGASAVTFQDAKNQPLYEPELGSTPLWTNTTVIGLFDAHEETSAIVSFLKAESGIAPFPKYKIDIVEDKDWEREWMTHFHPIRFGSKLWVCPSWKTPPEPGAINLMLDPGLAFGTGTHPTTALCLKWLDQQKDINGSTLVDYGCGSGILAIAACLLGAKQVVGVDIDSQALEATINNAQRNKIVVEKLEVFLPNDFPSIQVSYVIANILAQPLIALASKLAEMVETGGHLALSGIVFEQTEAVINAYSPWFKIGEAVHQEGWVLISGQRY
ncbi:MAG: 50S ribosomal protein L11 methyltransferase [Endozoicomonas sp. (ex Botrylloides leachii)]|nr:50S ribosomal protein L11 methyltransferase [Endozoicomonas sp. (ex Botrylloides leachii)]